MGLTSFCLFLETLVHRSLQHIFLVVVQLVEHGPVWLSLFELDALVLELLLSGLDVFSGVLLLLLIDFHHGVDLLVQSLSVVKLFLHPIVLEANFYSLCKARTFTCS